MYTDAPRAGFARRLSAIIYDILILCALVMLAAGVAMLFVQLLVWTSLLSLEGYEDIAAYVNSGWRRWLYGIYILSIMLGFYIYFWCKAGQTLGMRAWRMLLVTHQGNPLTFGQALSRLVLSLFGLGNFWLWLRWGKGLALQDQLTHTQMIVLTKEQSKILNLHKTAR
ncbi:RDD family protein [Alishewanella tabrizica]|uniref:RDD family protein n=1 Tax=Alishewanella tabrizica TaxID=671278 RepID=A0ABQ2WF30_9ALTE|nr:RDD family protein [Alishewanella tabrizica]GGW51864.1 RDD family protein [Alishewanella tabrizica]